MSENYAFGRWGPWIGALFLSVIVGIFAYNAGAAHGFAAASPAAGTTTPWPHYYWFHPFGFVFPFFFLLFWVFVARALFWGGPWRRRWYGPDGRMRASFDEWHRQAHERMERPS
jgi:hypothetical protein